MLQDFQNNLLEFKLLPLASAKGSGIEKKELVLAS
jgi:hypothetical protein